VDLERQNVYAAVVPENFDQCTLRDLCLEVCHVAVAINKFYTRISRTIL